MTHANPARSPPTACWRGDWPNEVCASSSSTIPAGINTAACPGALQLNVEKPTSASAALVSDLKRRGLLEDTLGDLGRRVRTHQLLSGQADRQSFGRDHHPRCFTIWMAGGGVKGGISYGETDPYCYNIAENPVHVHDLHATILHLLGIDHERLTFKYQGRRFRLTDVHGELIPDILA